MNCWRALRLAQSAQYATHASGTGERTACVRRPRARQRLLGVSLCWLSAGRSIVSRALTTQASRIVRVKREHASEKKSQKNKQLQEITKNHSCPIAARVGALDAWCDGRDARVQGINGRQL